jgi:hypothetical protein
MRSCDGIFSVNRVGALLTQQEFGSQVRSLTHKTRVGLKPDLQRYEKRDRWKKIDRFWRRARKVFSAVGQSSSVSRLTTLARRRRKKIKKVFGAPKISTEAVENFWIT